jgi:hypothetical protein
MLATSFIVCICRRDSTPVAAMSRSLMAGLDHVTALRTLLSRSHGVTALSATRVVS